MLADITSPSSSVTAGAFEEKRAALNGDGERERDDGVAKHEEGCGEYWKVVADEKRHSELLEPEIAL